MRLGILLERFDRDSGGAEVHTEALVRRAVATGHEVVCASLDGSAPHGAAARRVTAPCRRPARDRVFALRGVEALRAAGCATVLGFRHCPGVDVYLPHGGLVGDAIASQDRARGGVSIWRRLARATSGKLAWFMEAERELLASVEGPRVIAVSALVADRLRAAYPACAERVTVVENGVDTEHFAPGRAAEEGRRLREREGVDPGDVVGLLLARRPRRKGAAAALDALALVEAPRVHLFVGGGRIEPDLWRRARRLGVADRVHELGSASDPRPLYAAADLLVHPTYHDPCSLVGLEALAMGLPVVTTVHDGVAGLMGARGGIALEVAGDGEALAVALRVLADPALRAQTAEDARAVACRHPLEASLDRVLAVCLDHAENAA